MIALKSKPEIAQMRLVGRILAMLFAHLRPMLQPGVSTADLDQEARSFILKQGARPALEGYHGYPATLCTSVNEVVTHGIPGTRKLREGDILGIDVAARVAGFYADAAATFPIGEVSPSARRLLKATEQALLAGIAQAQVGNRLHDIGSTIQHAVESAGYSVVRRFTGHGIGRALHEDPKLPNFGTKGTGPRLVEGMTLAVEPVVNEGAPDTLALSDGWTVITKDRRLSAHFEHTIGITEDGPQILTIL